MGSNSANAEARSTPTQKFNRYRTIDQPPSESNTVFRPRYSFKARQRTKTHEPPKALKQYEQKVPTDPVKSPEDVKSTSTTSSECTISEASSSANLDPTTLEQASGTEPSAKDSSKTSVFSLKRIASDSELEEQMTLPEEVIMTDSGNDSESGNSSSAGNVSSPFASLTAGGRLAKLLAREKELIATLEQLTRDIENLENPGQGEAKADGEGAGEDEVGEDEPDDLEEFEAPEWCVPIKANVMTYDWDSLAAECQFDVILMDPPWQLATHAPTRGVAIAYQQLPDICIEELPVPKLSSNGFIFIWVINNKYAKAFDLMRRWGYRYVDDITWVKQTVNRRMAKGHGYYLQHAKETCLVGKKGDDPPGCRHSIGSDVIFSERRGQSQKPEELYELIEELVPNGRYLEIFGRKNNLRDYWVTVGNEL
ncbi:hypothetical protein BGX21_006968 [Mortierella sp. AD011]|nr:hypothetical protein BGX21_006968 [Mortierella sp. AD011]